MATRITYENATVPADIEITCDTYGDFLEFFGKCRIVFDRCYPGNLVADLAQWCETGELPPESPESVNARRERRARELLADMMKLVDNPHRRD